MDPLQALDRAKRPRTVLSGPYGHPLHPIMVTIPIGAWVSSFIFGLFAIFSGSPTGYVQGVQTLVAIGVIGAVLAAVLGLIDLLTIAAGTRARRTALTHMTLNLIVVALFVMSFIVQAVAGVGSLNAVSFVLIIVGLLILVVSGWLGGMMAYRYGVRVAREDTQAEAFAPRQGAPGR